MSILEVTNLNFKYTDNELYNDLTMRLLVGEHAVLVGKNGSGKSTLMNIIAKNIIPDSGSIDWLPNIRYSYLDQQLKVKRDVSIEDYLYEVFKDLFQKEITLNALYKSLETANENNFDSILKRANLLQEELEKKGFYQLKSQVGNVVNGLGIANYGMDTKLATLSGGQRARVFLAKMLLENPDVLLMDEPTNFLDIEHIDWLAKYLNGFKGAFMVISHDEYFLKSIAKIVFALDNKKIERYKGDFDFYLKERELRKEQYQNSYINQQRFIKETEAFIAKNIVRATSTKAAKSRRKQLEHLDVLDKPVGETHISFEFPFSGNLGEEVLRVKNLSIGYKGKSILPPINFVIRHYTKVAIVGQNGIGKSTLIKTIMEVIPSISGSFQFTNSAVINYFSQEEKMEELTPIEYFRCFYPEKNDFDIRSKLALLGITKSLVIKKMTELSGGEQTRVRLALMLFKKANLLILDEPTNHLDAKTKEALLEAIKKFPGNVIVVSHEKDIFEGVVDSYISLA